MLLIMRKPTLGAGKLVEEADGCLALWSTREFFRGAKPPQSPHVLRIGVDMSWGGAGFHPSLE